MSLKRQTNQVIQRVASRMAQQDPQLEPARDQWMPDRIGPYQRETDPTGMTDDWVRGYSFYSNQEGPGGIEFTQVGWDEARQEWLWSIQIWPSQEESEAVEVGQAQTLEEAVEIAQQAVEAVRVARLAALLTMRRKAQMEPVPAQPGQLYRVFMWGDRSSSWIAMQVEAASPEDAAQQALGGQPGQEADIAPDASDIEGVSVFSDHSFGTPVFVMLA